MRVVSAWICLVVSIFLLCSSTEAFWNKFIERRLVERKLQIERSTIGDWEEATLVEVDAPGPSKRDEPKWWFWKRQTGSTSGGNAGQPGGVPVATPGKQNLTGGPTTNTSGAAGNNTSGTTPGLIGNGDNPNERFVNCSDITTGRANKCWFDLNLTQYVNDWLDNAICVPGEGFASCFLRQNGFPGLDCSQISVSACPAPQSDSIITDPRRFYVAYNIYGKCFRKQTDSCDQADLLDPAINQFFYSWWTAVGSSGGIASNNIAQIVQIIDVPAETSVILQDILIALQSVFALIPGPLGIYAAHSAFSYQWQTAAQVISNAINVAPNVGRYLFPTDNTASQVVQLSQLSANFATVLQQVQSNLNQTLTSVMANVTEFLAFAEQGNFSAEAPSLPDQANYLYFAFNTYVISQALNGNNVYAVLGRGTNPQQLATNGTVTNYDINCDSYNDLNICDCWWYSVSLDIC